MSYTRISMSNSIHTTLMLILNVKFALHRFPHSTGVSGVKYTLHSKIDNFIYTFEKQIIFYVFV